MSECRYDLYCSPTRNEAACGGRGAQGWVRCGAMLEVRKSVVLSRGWVGLKPHCKPFFPLRPAKLDGTDGTGLRGRTQGHFITESVCPEDGKRIILQTGFIAGDNSLAEPTVGKYHIGWGYNIASFTAPNSLIFSNACWKVLAREWSGNICARVCQHVCSLRSLKAAGQQKFSCKRHCHGFSKCKMQDAVLYFTLHVPAFTLCLPLAPAGHFKETTKTCRNPGDTLPFCRRVLVNFVRTWTSVLTTYSLPVLLLLLVWA